MRHTYKYTNEQWIDLIHQCRASGLTDKAWCEQNGIHRSTLYHHIKLLREAACTIPATSAPGHSTDDLHEIVPVSMAPVSEYSQSETCPVAVDPQFTELPITSSVPKAVIKIVLNGCQIEITNQAEAATIRNTLSVLKSLC